MQGRVLVVDDEKAMVLALKGRLGKEGYHVVAAGGGGEPPGRMETGSFHVVITDLSMNGVGGMQVLEHARRVDPDLAVVMITAYGSEKIAVQAMKLGAVDYVPKPFDNDELRLVVRRVMDTVLLRRDHRRLLEQVERAFGFEQIVGQSPAMGRLFETIDKVADTDVTVLIRGASGTGKELVANALHYRSPRRAKPLVKMNCAALSQELVESELFGHEKGAFTGAIARREGKFEAADGGTLFLDEVGDMPLETQAKLLRAIQEKEVERVGGNTSIRVDVRLIAATNQDLEAGVRAGRFREDLYYRLRVVELVIPPLAERREDIPLLVDRFLKDAVGRFGREVKPLTGEALRACLTHPWKGNVRELRSAVEQALLLSPGPEITPADLFNRPPAADAAPVAAPIAPASFREAKERVVEAFEREYLVDALRRHGGDNTKAAEDNGLHPPQHPPKKRALGVRAAVEHADDVAAVALIGRRDALAAEVDRLTADLTELTREAEGAKDNLITFHTEILRLREERVRMLARLANAKARLRFQATLNGLSTDADIRALEEVRDHINRLVAETQVTRDLGDTELERRLGHIREVEAERTARAQLEELKRVRDMRLAPPAPPDPPAARGPRSCGER